MPTMKTKKHLLNTMDAQGYLQKVYGIYISSLTLAKYARLGLIGRKLTQRWYFTEAEIDEFVSAGK